LCDSVTSVQQGVFFFFFKFSPTPFFPTQVSFGGYENRVCHGRLWLDQQEDRKIKKGHKYGVLRGGGCGSLLREI